MMGEDPVFCLLAVRSSVEPDIARLPVIDNDLKDCETILGELHDPIVRTPKSPTRKIRVARTRSSPNSQKYVRIQYLYLDKQRHV